jgi:hypothetical protein
VTLQEVAGLQSRSTMFFSNDIPPLLARNVACQLRRLFDPFCPLKGARPKPVRTDAISADTAWSCNPANWGETARLLDQIPQCNAYCVVEPGNRRNGLTAKMQSGRNAPKERRTLLNRQSECGPHDRGELFVA